MAMAMLYSLSVFVRWCVHILVCLCVVSSTVFVNAPQIDGYWIGYYSLDLDIAEERKSMTLCFKESEGGGKK